MKKFKYRLKALERKRAWEKQSARQDMIEAKDELEEMKYQEQLKTAAADEAAEQVRKMAGEDSIINPESFFMALNYMAIKREDADKSVSNTQKAQSVYDEKFAEYVDADRNVKAVEKHKENDFSKYLFEQNIEFYKESDDMWLSRK